MSLPLLTALVIAISLAGSWVTIQTRAGGAWWWPVLPGLASYCVWAVATKWTTVNLVVLSAWWDVVVALTWFVGFWLIGGERISLVQWGGIVLLCIGMALINWRS